MRLFVTGGTGFIGSHFLKQASAAGHEIVALRRPGSRPRIALENEPSWLEGSLSDPWEAELATCDALVHLAAHGVNPATVSWESCFQSNVHDALTLWMRAIRSGVRRFTVCGSCFEYGRSGERYEWIPANAPLEPTGAYHSSKAAASMAAIGLAIEHRLEMTLVRPFHVYGEGEEAARLWPALRKAALAGEDFPMTGGEQVRDFLPVDDLASLLVRTLEQAPEPGQPRIINAGTGKPCTIRDFSEHWWREWQATGKLLIGALPYRKGEVMRYVPKIDPEAVS